MRLVEQLTYTVYTELGTRHFFRVTTSQGKLCCFQTAGPSYLWWALLSVVGPLICGGLSYLWWALLSVVDPLICGGPYYLWWALLSVVDFLICG